MGIDVCDKVYQDPNISFLLLMFQIATWSQIWFHDSKL